MVRQLLNALAALTLILAACLVTQHLVAAPVPKDQIKETKCKKCQCVMWTRFSWKPDDTRRYYLNLVKVGNNIPIPTENNTPTFVGAPVGTGQYWVSNETVANNKNDSWDIVDCTKYHSVAWDRSALNPPTLAFIQEYSGGTKICTLTYDIAAECTELIAALEVPQPGNWFRCEADTPSQ